MTTKEEVSSKGILVSQCVLDNNVYTVLGVLSGIGIFYKTKSKRHFVIAITIGTAADVITGYYGTCRVLRDDYEQTKAAYELIHPPVKSPSLFGNFVTPRKETEYVVTKYGIDLRPEKQKPEDKGEK